MLHACSAAHLQVQAEDLHVPGNPTRLTNYRALTVTTLLHGDGPKICFSQQSIIKISTEFRKLHILVVSGSYPLKRVSSLGLNLESAADDAGASKDFDVVNYTKTHCICICRFVKVHVILGQGPKKCTSH